MTHKCQRRFSSDAKTNSLGSTVAVGTLAMPINKDLYSWEKGDDEDELIVVMPVDASIKAKDIDFKARPFLLRTFSSSLLHPLRMLCLVIMRRLPQPTRGTRRFAYAWTGLDIQSIA